MTHGKWATIQSFGTASLREHALFTQVSVMATLPSKIRLFSSTFTMQSNGQGKELIYSYLTIYLIVSEGVLKV
jgi:hypothetical protein